ncbi:hypothetical protein [Paraburkholderia sp. DGU8]
MKAGSKAAEHGAGANTRT